MMEENGEVSICDLKRLIVEIGPHAIHHIRNYFQNNQVDNNEILENDDDGLNWIHYCTLADNLECLRYFIEERNVDINLKESKETCLHFSIQNGLFEVTYYLLYQGAELETYDILENRKPEEYDSQTKNSDRIKRLIQERKNCQSLEEFRKKDLLNQLSSNTGPLFLLPRPQRIKIEQDFRDKYFEIITKDSIFRTRNEEIKRLKERIHGLRNKISNSDSSLISQKEELESRIIDDQKRFKQLIDKKNRELEKLGSERTKGFKTLEETKRVFKEYVVKSERKVKSITHKYEELMKMANILTKQKEEIKKEFVSNQNNWEKSIDQYLLDVESLENNLKKEKQKNIDLKHLVSIMRTESEEIRKKNEENERIIEQQGQKLKDLEIKKCDPNENDIQKLQEMIDQNYSVSNTFEEIRKHMMDENRKIQQQILEIQRKKVEDMERQKEEEEDKNICKICYVRELNIALDCGHLICKECLDQLEESMNYKCPSCRSDIVGFKRIYK